MVRSPAGAGEIPPRPARAGLHFHCAVGFRAGPLTRARVGLLGPCFKTGRVGGRHRCGPRAPFRNVGRSPPLAARRGRATDWGQSGPVDSRVGGGGPRPPSPPGGGEREGAEVRLARGPGVSGEVGAGGRCRARGRAAASHLRPLTLPSRTGAGRSAPPRRKCTRRRPVPAPVGGRPLERERHALAGGGDPPPG